MKTEVWYVLDDEREPVTNDHRAWVIFRTGEDLITAISHLGYPGDISFDHDLGDDIVSVMMLLVY